MDVVMAGLMYSDKIVRLPILVMTIYMMQMDSFIPYELESTGFTGMVLPF
ncbi:MAG: hypothetical protein ACO3EZ_15370 [Prochlorotrichaceae cyanobacterium]